GAPGSGGGAAVGGLAGDTATGGIGLGEGSGGNEEGGTGGSGGSGGSDGDFPFLPSYILGADISWTLEQESGGAIWRDEGKTMSIERILVNHGFNYIRLRTFVCPDC